jgi:ubiquinone/menaquinone biosynthesis C-methylase UbiE
MRAHPEMSTSHENVRYLDAAAEGTGLPDACADIVTSAQSLAWMDPRRIFGEIGRILRPGGVFAAYDYRSLLTGSWALDQEFSEVRAAVALRLARLAGKRTRLPDPDGVRRLRDDAEAPSQRETARAPTRDRERGQRTRYRS